MSEFLSQNVIHQLQQVYVNVTEVMLIAFRFFCDSEVCRTSYVFNNIYHWLLGVR